jgi:hypothetical protein
MCNPINIYFSSILELYHMRPKIIMRPNKIWTWFYSWSGSHEIKDHHETKQDMNLVLFLKCITWDRKSSWDQTRYELWFYSWSVSHEIEDHHETKQDMNFGSILEVYHMRPKIIMRPNKIWTLDYVGIWFEPRKYMCCMEQQSPWEKESMNLLLLP